MNLLFNEGCYTGNLGKPADFYRNWKRGNVEVTIIYPIGSMVLVYMLTFGVYGWDPCYHIYIAYMDAMGIFIYDILDLFCWDPV